MSASSTRMRATAFLIVNMTGPSVFGSAWPKNASHLLARQVHSLYDASDPFYNPTFWGSPLGKLKTGETWTVTLDRPWELGPAGTQTVTVISVDKANGIAILKREG